LDTNLTDAFHNLSIALTQLGDITGAFDNAKIATKGGPDSVARLLNLGNTAVRAGELDRAGDAYRAALSLSPNDATIHGNLGILHYQKAQWDPQCHLLPPGRAVTLPADSPVHCSDPIRWVQQRY
jgi:Flp pilus assembly protein TadD